MISEIVTATRSFESKNFYQSEESVNYIKFITDNSFNEKILESKDDIVDIILDDNQQKFDRVTNLFISFIILVMLSALTEFSWFLYFSQGHLRRRNLLIDNMLQINELIITNYTLQVSKFCSLIEKDASELKRINYETLEENFRTQDIDLSKYAKKRRKKIHRSKGYK